MAVGLRIRRTARRTNGDLASRLPGHLLRAISVGRRAWLAAAVLALPLGAYFFVRALTTPGSGLSAVFAIVPILLVCRVWARPPFTWLLTGAILGITIGGAQGTAILLMPIALVAVALEIADHRSRTLRGVLLMVAGAVGALAILISVATMVYRAT